MLSKISKSRSQRSAYSFKVHVYLFIIIYLYIAINSVQTHRSKRLYENESMDNKELNTNTHEDNGTLNKHGMLFSTEHVYILTRKRRNKLKKSSEGNKRNMTILSQNIPQGTCKDRVEAYLDDIVNDLKPDILFINEVNANTVEESCPEGYKVIKGRLDNANKIRLSAIVKHNCVVEESEMSCELPTIKLKVNGWIVGPCIGQVSTSADRHTLNRFQSVEHILLSARCSPSELPQLLQRRADQLLALPHLHPRHIF